MIEDTKKKRTNKRYEVAIIFKDEEIITIPLERIEREENL